MSFTGHEHSAPDPTRNAIEHVRDTSHTHWLHIRAREYEPTMKLLTEGLGFHPLLADDALTDDERPELKELDDVLFFVVPAAVRSVPEDAKIVEVAFFLRENALVTVALDEVPSLATWQERLVGRKTVKEPRPAFLMHAVLDTLVDDYFPILDDFEEAVEAASAEFYEDKDVDDRESVKRIIRLKSSNLRLRRALSPLRDVLNNLQRPDLVPIPDELRPYVQDVHTNVRRLVETLDAGRDSVSNLFEIRLSLTNTRLSQTVEKITAISTSLFFCTVISGIYGMNFDHMPELKWRYGYPFALGLMLLSVAGVLLYFRRKRWI